MTTIYLTAEKKFRVVTQEYYSNSGWTEINSFVIEGKDQFVSLYLRISSGDANSTPEDRGSFAQRAYESDKSSYTWYKSENYRIKLDMIENKEIKA